MRRALISLAAIAGPALFLTAALSAVAATESRRPVEYLKTSNVRHSLTEGDTVLIVAVPRSAECLTFVTDNCAVCGKLNIAVSDIAPEKGKWREVEGDISFNGKRSFRFSLVGVGARYVRLSFHVEAVRQS